MIRLDPGAGRQKRMGKRTEERCQESQDGREKDAAREAAESATREVDGGERVPDSEVWASLIDPDAPGRSVVAIGRAFEIALEPHIQDSETRGEAAFHMAEIVFDVWHHVGVVTDVMRGRALSEHEASLLFFAVCRHIPYHQRLLRKALRSVAAAKE
jgi:hypothetical protein